MEFSYELKKETPSAIEIKLTGYFDEFAVLPDKLDFSKYQTVTIDFEDVNFINSGGVKVWVNYAELLDEYQELKVYFKNCKCKIVDQINIIEGFLPKNAKVLSVFVPVFCNACEATTHVFQDIKKLNENFNSLLDRIEKPCCEASANDKKNLEVDIVPDQYFRFLNF